jgi:hypothetical protein
MSAKKVIGWLALAFILLWILIAPAGAADFFGQVGDAIMAGVRNLITFFDSLSN